MITVHLITINIKKMFRKKQITKIILNNETAYLTGVNGIFNRSHIRRWTSGKRE
jgi:hypothetical protein